MPDADGVHHNTVAAIRRNLLRWYDRHRRDLPWRSEQPEPYHVLVSEAMLQQTQVATVVAYFQRFIDAFPTVARLAAADEQQVLRHWQGLGYYRRARNLHAAARAIVAERGGNVPDNVDALLTLPGVGRYTAGAIASIAFSRAEPLVDGNVMRVLARRFGIDAPVDQPATQNQLWALAERRVPDDRPGDFNQALMELGALVCTPKQPQCMRCPLASRCAARVRGDAEALPRKSGRPAVKAVTHHIVAVHRRGRYLFVQRPADGLWSNMWQMPTAEGLPGDKAGMLRSFIASYGPRVGRPQCLAEFNHQTTHRAIAFHLHATDVTGGRLKPRAGLWRSLHDIDDLPLPNPQRKAVQLLLEES